MLRSVLLFAAGLSVASLPVSADAIVPAGSWRIEASPTRCVAIRDYGAVDRPTTLMLTTAPKGSALQIAIVREAYLKGIDQAGATVTLDGKVFETFALRYPSKTGKKRAVALLNLGEGAAESLRTASEVDVNITGSPDFQFPIAPGNPMWAQLDQCLQRLRGTWNIGKEYGANIVQDARGSLQGLFKPEDYPRDALQDRQTGRSRFLLLIDEVGSVRDCMLLETSGSAVLDSRSCGVVVSRAKFIPAIGQDGKPVKSAWIQAVNWTLQ